MFDKSALRLPQIRCEEYLGWIYINLDPDAVPVKQCLSELTTFLEHYHMEIMSASLKKNITGIQTGNAD